MKRVRDEGINGFEGLGYKNERNDEVVIKYERLVGW